MKTHIEITKCYDVEIMDEEGNNLMNEWVYTSNQSEALARGRDMKKEVDAHPEIYDNHYYDEEM